MAPSMDVLTYKSILDWKICLGEKILVDTAPSPPSSVKPTCDCFTNSENCSNHVKEIEALSAKVNFLSSQLVVKEQEIAVLKERVTEKETKLRSYAKANVDLKREVHELGKILFQFKQFEGKNLKLN